MESHKSSLIVLLVTVICSVAILTIIMVETLINFDLPLHICQFKLRRKVSSPFVSAMKSFPWERYNDSIFRNDTIQIHHHSMVLLSTLLPFLLSNPPIPVNTTCHLKEPKVPSSFPCKPLRMPRKIGILLQFSFEVDQLEVYFNEIDSLVDKFFIVESVMSNSFYLKSKPLVWDRIKENPRFAKFLPKVVHFVIDDAIITFHNATRHKIWMAETLHEKIRWQKFLEWNTQSKYFGMDDLIGFGHADELPWRDNVYALKNCQYDNDKFPVTFGIWFPFPFIDSILRSDFPVLHHPYTFGDPTFWTLKKCLEYVKGGPDKFPSKTRGQYGSESHLLGGLHMSRYGYAPLQMIKLLTASEADWAFMQRLIKVGLLYSSNNFLEASRHLNHIPTRIQNRIINITSLEKKEFDAIVKMPQFIQCNFNRYPTLRRDGVDLRLI